MPSGNSLMIYSPEQVTKLGACILMQLRARLNLELHFSRPALQCLKPSGHSSSFNKLQCILIRIAAEQRTSTGLAEGVCDPRQLQSHYQFCNIGHRQSDMPVAS